MSSFRHIQTLALCFVIASVFMLIYLNFTMQKQTSVNQETYISELHAIILQLVEACKVTDSVIALCKTSEARGRLALLCKLAGGEVVLGQVTGVDVSNVINVSVYQERQIRKKMILNVDAHPLEQDLMDK